MTSFIYTIFISLIIIIIAHRCFYHLKHYLTNEETDNTGIFQSKKYDELIDELNSIKNKRIDLDDTIITDDDMESELYEFMNNVK
jgi:hypothetical protein